MADVMDAFLRGHQAGQAEQQHAQQFEENKLQQMVLRHHLSALKLDDALRANELTRRFADLSLGQEQPPNAGRSDGVSNGTTPAAVASPTPFGPFKDAYRLPSSDVNAPAPPAGIADVVTNMARARLSGGVSSPSAGGAGTSLSSTAPATAPLVPLVPTDPASGLPTLNSHVDEPIPAGYRPGGGPPSGSQNHAGMQAAGHVWVPPISIPELGVNIAGQWYSARAAREEEARRAIALKRAEQPLHNVGPEETVLQTNVDTGRPEAVYTNPNRRNKPLNEQYLDAQRRGDQPEAARILAAINATRERDPNDEFTREFLPRYARDTLRKPVADLTGADWSRARSAYTNITQPPPRPSWDVQTVHDDASGEDRLLRIDRTTGAVQRVILPAGVAAGRGKGADDPQLPRGVQSYLLQLRTTYGTDLLGAEKELSTAWPSLTAAHPRISANKTINALRQQFGAQAGASPFADLLKKLDMDPSTASGGRGAGGPAAPPAPPGWKYVPKPGGGWTAVEAK